MPQSTYQSVWDTLAAAATVARLVTHPTFVDVAKNAIQQTKEYFHDSTYGRDPQQKILHEARKALTAISKQVFTLREKIKKNPATPDDFRQIGNIRLSQLPTAEKLCMQAMNTEISEGTRLQSNARETAFMQEEFEQVRQQIDALLNEARGVKRDSPSAKPQPAPSSSGYGTL